ncbi:glucose-1-phosphatase [Streptobacillus moniliformis]|uniref:Glucose-1-phosphatase n=1 Tax=Streptobacillus moniliformis (strain ATCC 14647 / DSM 12112 / NCTC 10651 / 9901) TaxID=519441 RepID=D1AVC5_STRM9|nr:glucose-1-phosphatase [Streptobacillus moniliformis]ACZ01685.1 Glucose-1-phosphatase [Streptobacillus moniliformis DSM 12112]AVL43316.1 hypothetical protein CEP89_05595 [Streptobacillus moniliformis]QXW66360.1 hypothetical protein KX935_03955 [Streptobacillus moniliformis]SQA13136.1 Glucose-1-phosphatase precursor [Streptobacillus moniliformis]
MKLKKILIYSRHGIRYPLFNLEEISKIVDPEKIKWDFEDGILTKKGEILEYEFGKYLKKYLDKLNFNISTKEFHTNSMKRTILTSKLLALAMFPFENIEIEYMFKDMKKLDLNYNITLTKDIINIEKIEKNDEKIRSSYNLIEKSLGLKKDSIYNLKSEITIDDRGIIYSNGAFKYGTDIVDMYILKYYEGFKYDEIFKGDNFRKDLKEMSKVKDSLLDLLFADKEYINYSETNAYKLMLKHAKNDVDLSVIVGHDSNIATILSALDIDSDDIGNEFEKYPIGSKLIFKIYEDDSFDLDMLYYDVDRIRYMEDRDPICKNLVNKGKFK